MRAQIDLPAIDAYYLLLEHPYFGKLDAVSLDPAWNFELRPVGVQDAARVVVDSLTQDHLADGLELARPTHWLYEQTRAALSQYRALEAQGGWRPIPGGEAKAS